jgi:hypothetical protein
MSAPNKTRENLEKSKQIFSFNFEFFGLKHVQLGMVSQFNTLISKKMPQSPIYASSKQQK